jgi:drug/metabolite transporter (DMT)-like permease
MVEEKTLSNIYWIACVLGWGLWCTFAARAVSIVGPVVALSVSILTYGVASLFLMAGAPDVFEGASLKGIGWAVAGTLCGLTASASYLCLVRQSPAHLAASLTMIYPIVPAFIAIAGGQRIGIRDGSGIALCVGGAVLLSWR